MTEKHATSKLSSLFFFSKWVRKEKSFNLKRCHKFRLEFIHDFHVVISLLFFIILSIFFYLSTHMNCWMKSYFFLSSCKVSFWFIFFAAVQLNLIIKLFWFSNVIFHLCKYDNNLIERIWNSFFFFLFHLFTFLPKNSSSYFRFEIQIDFLDITWLWVYSKVISFIHI